MTARTDRSGVKVQYRVRRFCVRKFLHLLVLRVFSRISAYNRLANSFVRYRLDLK